MQNEITTNGKLLDKYGSLNRRGYSKRMVLGYDRADIRAPGHRIKEWDYYLVMCGDFAVALTVADNSYMGLVSVAYCIRRRAVGADDKRDVVYAVWENRAAIHKR